MDYKKHYEKLMIRAKNRVRVEAYYERHHIIPRCMGGKDDSLNIALLTPEEHYVAHQLLVKIYPENKSLVFAARMMIPNRASNKLYGWIRRRFRSVVSDSQIGEKNSQYGTKWITDGTNNCKIRPHEQMPHGWSLGRTIEAHGSAIPKILTRVRMCTECRRKKDTIYKIKAKHTNIRKSKSYRRAKSIKLYSEFKSSGVSLRKFAISKSIVPMTLSNWFKEFIPEYNINPRISANKQL